jgi:hypothetical protein
MSRVSVLLSITLLLVISAAALVYMASDADDSAPIDDGPIIILPQDIYPDADVIITANDRGYTLVTFKAYGNYEVTEDHPSIWFTETYRYNQDLTVRNISDVNGSLKIVFDGAIVKKLTLLVADSRKSLNAGIDLDFTMYSGKIQVLNVLSVSNSAEQYLPASYDAVSMPIRSANIHLMSGTMDLYNPTSDLVSISDYTLTLDYKMSVNRLFTTGENGKYSNVLVRVFGASIGYMSNIASKIGNLEYEILSGSIDYFAIGANSEHNSSRILSSMATSYVSGDVQVYIGSETKFTQCIIGAGILNTPHILCNGEVIANDIIHMVLIDAPGTIIYNDLAFLTERRNTAYHFYDYKIGQMPYPTSIMDYFKYNNSSEHVYSDKGIWRSMSSSVLPVGAVFSINTMFTISQESVFTISNGATMYNSDDFIINGTLNIDGTLVNNSFIQSRPGCVINGEPIGVGSVADYVYYSEPTSNIDVMSQTTAIVVAQNTQYPIERISANLYDDNRSVTIAIDGSQRIFADQISISLVEVGSSGDFVDSYRLEIKGIDRNLLGLCTVDVTLPVNQNECTAVYVYNPNTLKYDLIATAEYESSVTFDAGSKNHFYLYTYTTDRPELPDYSPIVINTEIKPIDYWLFAAILAVLAVTVYALITMRRP